MSFRSWCSLGVLSFVPFAIGCGNDCESWCEAQIEEECCEDACPDGYDCDCPDEDDIEDCEDDCEDALEDAEEYGCEEEFDELMSCASGADDICEPYECEVSVDGSSLNYDCSGDCGSEAEKVGNCVIEFCEDNPNDNQCSSLE